MKSNVSTQLTLAFFRKKTAPCKMARGSATADGRYGYFIPNNSTVVYKYEWSGEKKERLPPCRYYDSRLVIINRELVAVGGWGGSFTKKTVNFNFG